MECEVAQQWMIWLLNRTRLLGLVVSTNCLLQPCSRIRGPILCFYAAFNYSKIALYRAIAPLLHSFTLQMTRVLSLTQKTGHI